MWTTKMKNDITNKSDIKLLVDTFYDKVKANSTIGNIFNDIAKVDYNITYQKCIHFGQVYFRRT